MQVWTVASAQFATLDAIEEPDATEPITIPPSLIQLPGCANCARYGPRSPDATVTPRSPESRPQSPPGGRRASR